MAEQEGYAEYMEEEKKRYENEREEREKERDPEEKFMEEEKKRYENEREAEPEGYEEYMEEEKSLKMRKLPRSTRKTARPKASSNLSRNGLRQKTCM